MYALRIKYILGQTMKRRGPIQYIKTIFCDRFMQSITFFKMLELSII